MYKVKIDHYILEKTLGKGAFGKVKLAYHEILGEKNKVAIKIINKEKLKNNNLSNKVKREIKMLKFFDNPNIVKIFQILETNSKLFIVMEYLEDGDFFDYLLKKAPLSEEEARFYLKQIISGVEYCHKNRIAHRDLKPENLLLSKKHILKIIDFGLSNYLYDGIALKTCCGSLKYAAPEILCGKKYIGSKIDIWSIGIILFIMLHGSFPFDDEQKGKLILKITKGEFKLKENLSGDVKELIKMMLEADSMKRITINEIKSHNWYNKLNENLNMRPPLLLEYYSKYYKNQIHEHCLNKILKKNFNFNRFNKEDIINKILNKKDNSFVIGYEILLNLRRLKKLNEDKEANSNISKETIKDNSYIFKSFINNIDLNLENINKILMKKYEFFWMDKTKSKWHLGYRIKKNFLQLILDFLNICKENEIKINIKNKKKFKFLCNYDDILFLTRFYKNPEFNNEEYYFINISLIKGNPFSFLFLCSKITLSLQNKID